MNPERYSEYRNGHITVTYRVLQDIYVVFLQEKFIREFRFFLVEIYTPICDVNLERALLIVKSICLTIV